jgi:hypothetical protein
LYDNFSQIDVQEYNDEEAPSSPLKKYNKELGKQATKKSDD